MTRLSLQQRPARAGLPTRVAVSPASPWRAACRTRRLVAKCTSEATAPLDIEPPDISGDLLDVHTELGGLMDGDGVITSYGPQADRKAEEAWQHGLAITDRSHWGRLRFTGDDRTQFLHQQTTQDVQSLEPGQSALTVFVSPTGRTIDTGTLLILKQGVLVITSPKFSPLWKSRLETYIFPLDRVQIEDVAEHTRMFTVLGPAAEDLIKGFGSDDVVNLGPGEHKLANFDGAPVMALRDAGLGPTVPGWTFIMGENVASEFFRRCAMQGALPMGAKMWERARTRCGIPRVGRELTKEYNPLEAGLYHAVSLQKGCYLGQETIAKVHNLNARKMALWGVQLRAECPLAIGATVRLAEADFTRYLGVVTSFVRTDEDTLAMAYLRTKHKGQPYDCEGARVTVGEEYGKVVPLPAVTTRFKEEEAQRKVAESQQAQKLRLMEARMREWRERQGAQKLG